MDRPARWILGALTGTLVVLTGYGDAQAGHAPPRRAAAVPAGTVAEYPSMTALRKVEKEGVAYQLSWTITDSPLVVVAPHGGGIEPRTSEIASAIAGDEHTQCQFKGILPSGNYPRLHVTSTHWDVEECLILIGQRTHALSVHGTSKAGSVAYIGGRDTATGAELATALRAAGFTVVQPAPADIAGTSPDNFVNKDADGAGVQLELTYGLRTDLFPTKDQPPSTRGRQFADAVRAVYAT